MNEIVAQAQMRAMEKTLKRATKSKEAAIYFLKDAGIIPGNKRKSKKKAITKKSK